MRIDTGFQAYSDLGNYQRRNIPQVSVEEVKRQDEERKALESGSVSASVQSAPRNNEESKVSRIANLEDVAISFKNSDQDIIGRDSDLFGLDVQKAVSDMKKDSIIEEYQTFVGSMRNNGFNSNDGIVIPKFNFDF